MTIYKNKLKTTYAAKLKEWKSGKICFNQQSFEMATLLLKNGLLPENAQYYYAQQIEQAITEAIAQKRPLTAFFQTESSTQNRSNSEQTLAKKVQNLINSGLTKKEAIQKIAIEHKISTFNVNKAYRLAYGN